jgi:hypothetical protein
MRDKGPKEAALLMKAIFPYSRPAWKGTPKRDDDTIYTILER